MTLLVECDVTPDEMEQSLLDAHKCEILRDFWRDGGIADDLPDDETEAIAHQRLAVELRPYEAQIRRDLALRGNTRSSQWVRREAVARRWRDYRALPSHPDPTAEGRERAR